MRFLLLVWVWGGAFALADATPELIAGRCEQCHGEGGVAAIPGWPPIAGVSAPELASKLEGYRGQQNPDSVMAAAAHDLSDQEIADLARYYQDLALQSPEARSLK